MNSASDKPVILLTYADNASNLPELNSEREKAHTICARYTFWEAQQSATVSIDSLFTQFEVYSGRITVFHYSGHAGKDLLGLEDVSLQGKTLATLIQAEIQANPQSLAFVFLNGCATKEIAEKLKECGVRCVVATNRKVFDTEAKKFAIKFYETWTSHPNISIQTAYNVAREYVLNDEKALEMRGSYDAEEDGHPSVWCLVESVAGIANEITLGSLTQNDTPEIAGIARLQNDTQIIIEGLEALQTLTKEIKQALKHKRALQIVVLASTWQDYQTLPASVPVPWLHYGTTVAEWKPYLNENIAHLLGEFSGKSSLSLDVVYVNRFQFPDEDGEWENDFRQDVCEKAICILDAFALNFEENKAFAMLFNPCPVGGFLVPVSQELTTEQKTHGQQHLLPFKGIQNSWRKKFNKPYLYIDLDIPHKYLLFRRLADIAFKHLDLPETVDATSLEQTLQKKNTKTGKSQNLG